jgi:glycogen debranching enzyme
MLPAVARRALELRRQVVKDDGLLWIADPRGDVHPDWLPLSQSLALDDTLAAVRLGRAEGVGCYYRGQRILSCCVLAIEGELLPTPAAVETNTYETCLAFPELHGRRAELSAFRHFLADGTTLRQWITLESQSLRASPVSVTLTLSCDGLLCEEVGAPSGDGYNSPALDGTMLVLTRRMEDGSLGRTIVHFDRAPFALRWLGPNELRGVGPRVAVSFRFFPVLAEPATLAFSVAPGEQAPEPTAQTGRQFEAGTIVDFDAATAAVRERHARDLLRGAIYDAYDPALNAILGRSAADLQLLLMANDTGEALPVAGLPDRPVISGRDALMAGFMSLALAPEQAIATLSALARQQVRDERHGERDGQIPDGSADLHGGTAALAVTPLWVALLAETLDWTGNLALFEELLPVARRAVRWMERQSDPHGYVRAVSESGAMATGIVLAPQAYTVRARRTLARALRRSGARIDHAEVAALELSAERLRQHVERDFWMGDAGAYAPTVNGAWQPERHATSAAAHALWSQISAGPRAARLADRLTAPDLLSGWGLRSRSAMDQAFNPLHPTRGAVWTHETALAAIGLLRSGHVEAGMRLARGVFDVARSQIDARLPAFFGGQQRSGPYAEAPLWHPAACMPAALAVASPAGLVAAMLGCEPDAVARQLILRPVLPVWLRRLSVRHLRVGSAWVDVDVTRIAHDGGCDVQARVTGGECRVLVQPRVRAFV